ncbi:MAG TPA: GtrA family protein [Ktedonobacteraceae bacterium]|nr:GtrA family protein [Ktedonobacteraceae bacterium]
MLLDKKADMSINKSPSPLKRLVDFIFSDAMRPIRFLFIGGMVAIVQLIVLGLLLRTHMNSYLANAIAFLFSAQLNFILNSIFTWQGSMNTANPRSDLLKRWVAFHGTIAFTGILNLLVFTVIHFAFPHLLTLVASAAGILVAAVVNFFGMDKLVFRPDPKSKILPKSGLTEPTREA